MPDLILASGSAIRAELLTGSAVPFRVRTAPVDEAAIKQSLLAEGHRPRDIADALAEAKAQRVGMKEPEHFVLGCDQVLDLDGQLLSKPETREELAAQLSAMSGKTHKLFSAAVIFHETRPIWRFVGEARLTMKTLSSAYIETYLDRNWPEVSHSVGGYMIEKEGPRLFSRVDGDHFSILGLPLLPLLAYLETRGVIAT
ncbi:Maf family protein [Pseudooceanicola sp. C21-150M6]|uniref:Maf family protein n=1 Tax=Pseudooceanicola sp. C21-150M6 TaxID=3434355 RepID=UPI003D7F3F98